MGFFSEHLHPRHPNGKFRPKGGLGGSIKRAFSDQGRPAGGYRPFGAGGFDQPSPRPVGGARAALRGEGFVSGAKLPPRNPVNRKRKGTVKK